MNRIIVCSLLIPLFAVNLWADQLMEPAETEALVRHLTDNPQKCWISQGTIQARHMEYHEFDNSMREAAETIYYDGSQYRLEIHLEDGISLNDSLGPNPPRQFKQDFKLNRNRIFIWDGQQYTQYYQSADYAIVLAEPQNVPTENKGPATTGIIPWGQEHFSFSEIMSKNPTSYSFNEDGQNKIRLQYINHDIFANTLISFVFDPSKDYALLSYSIENNEALLRQTYENYFQAGGQWVPSKILIERFDKRSGTPELVSYEDWKFETVDVTAPSNEVFFANFKAGTMVELKAAENLKPFFYNASDQVDISNILEDKVALLQNPDAVNCATAAVRRIAKHFSKSIQQSQLASLVSADTKKTALSDMKQMLEEIGLNCMAIATDLEMLKKMPDCTKVLFLPLSNHYVILDHIDSDGIWLIDLTSRKFYIKRSIDEFLQEWDSGIAMLVSNEPITPPLDADFRYLQEDEMSQILGGDSFGKYSCTDQLQTTAILECPEPIGGFLCTGAYYYFEARKGCIEDENGGTCIGQKMPSYKFWYCYNHPTSPGSCLALNDPQVRYIRACE